MTQYHEYYIMVYRKMLFHYYKKLDWYMSSGYVGDVYAGVVYKSSDQMI
jgi:hypothetical protein